MIRQISINVPDFINNWLPVHRRKVNWLSFLQVLLAPFTTMMGEYKTWRNASTTRAYVSGEKISMEWYLNELYDPVDREIYIDSPNASGVFVALQTELLPVIWVGDQNVPGEDVDFQYMSLPYEDITTGNNDFIVFVPVGLAAMESGIRNVVANYKLAGKRYTIEYF